SGALTFELLHNSADNAARHDRDPARQSEDQDSARSRLALARVLVGAGGSLAALGGVLVLAAYAIPSTEKHAREGIAVACLPNKCQATVSGKF
ncbi:MAG TPA: hypothetical protein VHZ95_13265, partial [Polyangiales bacterium]|nr:hypothetical protein [Polyangiales bacterium]